MAIIMRVGGGGGGGLDLTVLGGTTQPENPKNNTLWINTDVAFEEVHLAPTQPILHSTTKNKFACPLPSQSITIWTFKEDGGIDGAVVANATKSVRIGSTSKQYWLDAGTYTVSGSPVVASGTTSFSVINLNTEEVIAESVNGQAAVFTLEAETNVYVKISYTGNEDAGEETITVSFYPQIEEGETATEFVKGEYDNAVWVNTSNRYQSDASAIASTTHVLDVAEDPFLRINVLQFKQWDGTAWVWRDGSIYANNAWTDMALYIYWNGTQNEAYPLGYSRGGGTSSYDLDSDPTFEDDHFVVTGSKTNTCCVFGVKPGYGINADKFTTLGFKSQKTSGTFNDGLAIGFTSNVDGSTTGSEYAVFDAQLFEIGTVTALQEVSVPITATGMVRPVGRFTNANSNAATAVNISVFYWVLT